jgi:hypothetical protein
MTINHNYTVDDQLTTIYLCYKRKNQVLGQFVTVISSLVMDVREGKEPSKAQRERR